ncbi:unnamed protein product, partial [Allacma fusca]
CSWNAVINFGRLVLFEWRQSVAWIFPDSILLPFIQETIFTGCPIKIPNNPAKGNITDRNNASAIRSR